MSGEYFPACLWGYLLISICLFSHQSFLHYSIFLIRVASQVAISSQYIAFSHLWFRPTSLFNTGVRSVPFSILKLCWTSLLCLASEPHSKLFYRIFLLNSPTAPSYLKHSPGSIFWKFHPIWERVQWQASHKPERDQLRCKRHSSVELSTVANSRLKRCVRCRRQKIKCSGTQPCYSCSNRNFSCIFDDMSQKVLVTRRSAIPGLTIHTVDSQLRAT